MHQRKEGETEISWAGRMQRLGEFGMSAEVSGWKPEEHGLNQFGQGCAEVPCQVCAAALLLARRWLWDAALAGAQGDVSLAERAVADVPEYLIKSNPGAAIGDAMARGLARSISHAMLDLPGEYTIAAVKSVVEDADAEVLPQPEQG